MVLTNRFCTAPTLPRPWVTTEIEVFIWSRVDKAPPAVVNAVVDALSPLGITHIDMPLTPHRVWQAIQDAKKGGE